LQAFVIARRSLYRDCDKNLVTCLKNWQNRSVSQYSSTGRRQGINIATVAIAVKLLILLQFAKLPSLFSGAFVWLLLIVRVADVVLEDVAILLLLLAPRMLRPLLAPRMLRLLLFDVKVPHRYTQLLGHRHHY